ncbi:hypothetical protein DSCA_52380 [Desulfosarcina alkanivorans]|uniref:Uncharacterized protein n=1 Tax=Desulfosarcina alkanivorans TaxID=571177 RepID=A0A5K7YRG7_9BACT|nr:hypothetical protein DSCA_52380 [Desulfosarcina alkanivorans]
MFHWAMAANSGFRDLRAPAQSNRPVCFYHSRLDPAWQQPIDRSARRVESRVAAPAPGRVAFPEEDARPDAVALLVIDFKGTIPQFSPDPGTGPVAVFPLGAKGPCRP